MSEFDQSPLIKRDATDAPGSDVSKAQSQRSTAGVLAELKLICHGATDFHSLRGYLVNGPRLDSAEITSAVGELLDSCGHQIPIGLIDASVEICEELVSQDEDIETIEPLVQRLEGLCDQPPTQVALCKCKLMLATFALSNEFADKSGAKEYLEAAYRIREQFSDPISPELGYLHLNELAILAELQQEFVDFESANATSERIITIVASNPDKIDRSVIRACRAAADVFNSVGNYERAEEIFDSLCKRAHLNLDETDAWEFGLALRDYGDILASQPDQSSKAELVLNEAFKLLDMGGDNFDQDGPLMNVIETLCDVYSKTGRISEAMELRAKYLGI